MRQSWLLAALLIASTAHAAAAPEQKTPPTEDITVLGQRPAPAPITPDTSYWVEDAFATYPLLGPTFAKGLIIWNHQESFDGTGAELPPLRVIEGLAELGWDVVRLQRNSRLKTGFENKMADVRDQLGRQLASAKVEGYQRIILAGQQVGGALALEAGKEVEGIYAIVAFAPNPGILWKGAKTKHPSPIPTDDWAGEELDRTWDQLTHTRAGRLFILFPDLDEEVPHERGPKAREILTQRGDLPFLLVDETSGVRTTHGAETADFRSYASCMDLFLSPELTPRIGEFHCGADEIPAALAQMGVKPHGGEAWIGYSSTGQTIYLELPASGKGPATYGWGAGAYGKIRPGIQTIDVKPAGDAFTASLTPDQAIRGVHIGTQLRITIDQDDGTRASVAMHRLPGNS